MKSTFLLISVLLIMTALLFTNAKENVEGYEVGNIASDFELPNIDGTKVSLSDFDQAKGFIIVFTCNTCPYARAYEQRIIDLDRKYNSLGFPIIAINPNDVSKSAGDSMKEMKTRAIKMGYTFPYLRDDDQSVTIKYGAKKTPHIYVLNKDRNTLLVEYIGAIDDSPRDAGDVRYKYVEDAIDALVEGNKPTVVSKKAIGCGIKWNSRADLD
jgi:peroxiredoxin